MKKREFFKVEGDRIVRLRRNCPKCGDGVFLAEHKNRHSCGTCGYTEFKGVGKKIPQKPVIEDRPLESKKETKSIDTEMEQPKKDIEPEPAGQMMHDQEPDKSTQENAPDEEIDKDHKLDETSESNEKDQSNEALKETTKKPEKKQE